ncbi:uroporphyrinogen-III synthase [Paracoccus pacificus]|uniref:Uroporphyrinogen-III synthase n=1 Tax=Paracoccus pacificus TaxID=1463598 RepID=A0ABW4R237_9RHOB
MTRNAPPLLLTRPEPGATRFADAFARRFGPDWPVIRAPALAVEPVSFARQALEDASAVILTSPQAAARAGPGRGRLAYAVGDQTALAATQAGFRAISAKGDAAALARLIRERHGRGDTGAGPLFYPHGRQRAADLAALLPELRIVAAVVYEQRPLPPPAEVTSLHGPLLVPVFSPFSARIVAGWLAAGTTRPWVAAISASAAAGFGQAARLAVAVRPDAGAVLDALELLLDGGAGTEQS